MATVTSSAPTITSATPRHLEGVSVFIKPVVTGNAVETAKRTMHPRPSERLESNVSSLLRPQRLHRIDPGRAPGRQVAGDHCDQAKQQHHQAERQRIGCRRGEQQAIDGIPNAAPAVDSRTPSVSSCRINRPRPAPSAIRTADSRLRAEARASRRLARFAQTINSTNPTAAQRTSSDRRIVERENARHEPPGYPGRFNSVGMGAAAGFCV